jgi:hypothetical protein
MIVLLASYPRSGNTMVRQVIEAVYGLPTFSHYRNEQRVGLWPDRHYTEEAEDENPVCFVKTHSEECSDYPTIHIVRDGRDAIVSEAHFGLKATIMYGPHKPRQLMCELVEGRGPWDWSHHCRTYSEREAPTVRVHYEELLKNPVRPIIAAVQKLGVPIEPQCNGTVRLPSFGRLHRQCPDFYRRGKAGIWQEEMPPDVQGRFWAVHGEMMEQMGYCDLQCKEQACLVT